MRKLVYSLDFVGRKGNVNYKIRQEVKIKHLEIKINLQNVSKQKMMETEINT